MPAGKGCLVWRVNYILLTSELHSPDFSLSFLLQTDASDRELGAVLSQEIEGEEWPVLYISRKLSKRETKYNTIEKECLAIWWAVVTFRYYLLVREFTLCSDHAPLQWLHHMKDTNVRITRWYLALQPFKFQVVHRPGVHMAVADFLSRNGGGGGGLQAGLIDRLQNYTGIQGQAFRWFRSYLSDLYHFVHLNGESSQLSPVKYGVP